MSKALREHQRVGEAYLAEGGRTVRRRIDAPAPAVWSALLDARAWTQWLPITQVTWTSPAPFGVGTTRTVQIGQAIVEESFFAWEEGRRMAFCFERSSLPVSAAVEDYRVEPQGGACELIWKGRASAVFPLGFLVTRQLASGISAGLPKLEALIKSEPGRFGL